MNRILSFKPGIIISDTKLYYLAYSTFQLVFEAKLIKS